MSQSAVLAQMGSQNQSFRNRIINGAMMIDQRSAGASTTVASNGYYSCDRWKTYASPASKYSVQQNAGSVTLPVGFTNYIGITSTSAYSVSSGDYFWLEQSIEGYNISDLAWGTANAKPVTLSFQVYSSLTGQFGGSIASNSRSRSYPFSYTISSANTWTTVSVTVPGDTSGTWLTTNGIGIAVLFDLGTGSTYLGTAGSWNSAGNIGATGDTKVVSTSGATFYITGVQLEAGTTATPFELRSYGTELSLCQRYYQRYGDATNAKYVGGLGSAVSTAEFDLCFTMPVTMRSAPTMNYANLQIVDGAGATFTPSSITTYQATTTTAGLYMGATGLTTYRPYFLRTSSASGYLDATAEL